jgi:hypothetical protein
MHNNTHDYQQGPAASQPAEPQFVTKAQLARTLCVCPRTIDNWVQQKRIPSIPISPRCRRFHVASVMAALRRLETEVSA